MNSKTPLAIIFGAVIIGAFVFAAIRWQDLFSDSAVPSTTGVSTQPVSSPPITENKVVPSPTATPPTTKVDDKTAIKLAMIQKTGIVEANMEFTITDQRDRWAKGNVRDKNDISGAYFIAAKTESEWLIVYDGQAHPTCLQIAPYDFPVDMVPECLNSTGNVVSR